MIAVKKKSRFGPPVQGHDYFEIDRGYTSPCWEWQKAIDPSTGYGHCHRNGYSGQAHRLYYLSLVGAVPEGYELDHLCRNRRCVNPRHLEAVKPVTNRRRGRVAKISEEIANLIRELYASGKHRQVDLAKKFRVTQQQISKIVRYKDWKHVDSYEPLAA